MGVKEKLLQLNIFVDNEYLDKYVELIQANLDTCYTKHKTQKHHVIPRCYFVYYKLDIDNTTVNLLYKDHALAHYYLYNACGDNLFKYKLGNALYYLLNIKKYGDIKLDELDDIQAFYESIIAERSKLYKGNERFKQWGRNTSKTNIGRKHSEEWNKHISLALKGKPGNMLGKHLSDETKAKLSAKKKLIGNGHTGMIWVNNGEVNHCIIKQELQNYLDNGYRKGRLKLNISPEGMQKRIELGKAVGKLRKKNNYGDK